MERKLTFTKQSNMTTTPSVTELLSKSTSTAEIIEYLGTIYEHSSWVVEQMIEQNKYQSITTVSQLASCMKQIVDESSHDVKMKLLCCHPDLCEKVGTLESLTKESQEEQSRSGLQSLSNHELEQFTNDNTQYRSKFGFPFILAVRNATKFTVLAALHGRLQNTIEIEFVTALQQVHKIAWMRLLTKINTSDAKGYLTCHVLDTANGCPGTIHRYLAFLSVSSTIIPHLSF